MGKNAIGGVTFASTRLERLTMLHLYKFESWCRDGYQIARGSQSSFEAREVRKHIYGALSCCVFIRSQRDAYQCLECVVSTQPPPTHQLLTWPVDRPCRDKPHKQVCVVCHTTTTNALSAHNHHRVSNWWAVVCMVCQRTQRWPAEDYPEAHKSISLLPNSQGPLVCTKFSLTSSTIGTQVHWYTEVTKFECQ